MIRGVLRRKRGQLAAVSALALLVGLGLSAGVAGASNPNTQTKVPVTNANINCDGSPAQPPGISSGSGKAVMTQTANGGAGTGVLNTGVTLQGATPNATYNIRIIQDPNEANGPPCGVVVGTVTTDALGYGKGGWIHASANRRDVLVLGAQQPGKSRR
jgi:hypothetical protein